jgi:hypothetical protein
MHVYIEICRVLLPSPAGINKWKEEICTNGQLQKRLDEGSFLERFFQWNKINGID